MTSDKGWWAVCRVRSQEQKPTPTRKMRLIVQRTFALRLKREVQTSAIAIR